MMLFEKDAKLVEFHSAILDGNVEKIEMLISEDIDINCANPHTGKYALLEAVAQQKEDLVKILISAGADVNVRNDQGETSLHLAVEYHKFNANIIRHIIDNGGEPNIQDKLSGNTPLHILARFYGANWKNNRPEVLEILTLLTTRCQVNVKNFRGFTPLHFAAAATDNVTTPVKILLEAGADPNILNYRCETPLHDALDRNFSNIARELVEYGADVTISNKYEQTPLHYAARRNCVGGISVLLSRPECDVNVTDISGNTALHISAGKGFTQIVKNLILHPQIDVNKRDNLGVTPLHVAIESGFSEIVRLLLEAKSDIFIKTEFEQTALDLAQEKHVKNSHPEIEAMVLQIEAMVLQITYQENEQVELDEDICTKI